MTEKTITMKVADLRINPQNPRFIKDARYNALVKSLKDFPEMIRLRPIVCDETHLVLGGNYRVRALRDAGVIETRVTVAEGLTEKQKREFILKDNQNFGEWDEDALEAWDLEELEDWDILADDEPDGVHEITESRITPFRKTHILLSFPPERLTEIAELLEHLADLDFIEIEQSSTT